MAVGIAKGIAHFFQVVGVLAVEFFVTPQGLLVNEIAPRPHNSGHYTLDACFTSQFEQLIRAVCGLPLGSTQLLTPAVMINILGSDLPKILENISEITGNVKIHLYGKRGNPAPKRKMGHLLFKTDCPEQTDEIIKTF
ncbi:MAG: 5-(carboxyamino)imidazole ribonucleotide synthase [Bacteroidetes bacterium]|nr:MAG: 5-(carboxyamino)imidazole ribonucleotide synthase [Bacteroidota bacterium]